MTVIAPADAEEMRRAMLQSLDHQGPIYIRIAKGGDPIVTSNDIPFEIGKAFLLRLGSDALIITTGITLGMGLEASERFKEQGLQVAVLHVPTIKPLDVETIIAAIARVPVVVTIEEHTLNGGLGSVIAEIIAEANFSSRKYFKRIGIPDVFADRYGSQASLMEFFGITASKLVAAVTKLLASSGRKDKLCEEELAN